VEVCSEDPEAYHGQWARWREAWGVVDDLVSDPPPTPGRCRYFEEGTVTEPCLEQLVWKVAMRSADQEREARKQNRTDTHLRLNRDIDAALALVAEFYGISKSSLADILLEYILPRVDHVDIGAHLEQSRSTRWLWVANVPTEGLLESVRAALGQDPSLQEGQNEG